MHELLSFGYYLCKDLHSLPMSLGVSSKFSQKHARRLTSYAKLPLGVNVYMLNGVMSKVYAPGFSEQAQESSAVLTSLMSSMKKNE